MKSCATKAIAFLAVLAGIPLAAADAKDPSKGLNFFSVQEERAMGERYAAELGRRLRFVRDPAVSDEIETVGRRLAGFSPRRLDFRFFVVDTREVNAFAVPGGFIYVNRGLIELADSEDELAGVLAHEIAHTAARHSTREMSKKLLWAVLAAGLSEAVGSKSRKWGDIIAVAGGAGLILSSLKYSRNDEYQADSLGADLLAAAGYSPYGLVRFFEKIGGARRPSRWEGALAILNTHPPASNRIDRLQTKLAAAPDTSVSTGLGFRNCRNALASLPLPPQSEDLTLTSALAAIERSAVKARVETAFEAPDSREFTVPADSLWMETGIEVQAGDEITFAASGEVQPIRKDRSVTCGPDGIPGTGKGFWKQVSSGNTGSLVARIRTSEGGDKRFAAGAMAQWRAPAAGFLDLGVNDDNLTDNIGEYHVVVAVRRARIQ